MNSTLPPPAPPADMAVRLRQNWRWLKKRLKGEPRVDAYSLDKREVARFLPPNPTVIDAGAFDGADSEEMARMWPGSTIYALEPVPHAYARARARLGHLRNVRLYQAALSDRTEIAKMHVSEGRGEHGSDQSSSLLAPASSFMEAHPSIRFGEDIEVPAFTIPDFMAKVGIPHVDFLWLDLQGHEGAVVQAAEPVLPSVRALYIEVSEMDLYEGAMLYPDLRAWLGMRGFRVEHECASFGDSRNVLFVKA